MIPITFERLGQRPLWQIGLALLALYLAAFVAIVALIRLLGALGTLLGIVGASVAVAWVFLGVSRLRHEQHEDEWVGS